MDTKSKKRKIFVSFVLFFLSVSLLLSYGVRLAEGIYAHRTEPEISGVMNQDYQNTRAFRRCMQERLSNFLSIACGGGPGDYYYAESGGYYEGEAFEADEEWEEVLFNSWDTEYKTLDEALDSEKNKEKAAGQNSEKAAGQNNTKAAGQNSGKDTAQNSGKDTAQENGQKLTKEERNAAAAKAYHESLKRNKNLLYRICFGEKELYSNMEGVSWNENSKKLPDGYNFLLRFSNGKASIMKDGKELDIYGDGYYRGSQQWYVPGYQNFEAGGEVKQAEVVMLAAENPVQYSYVRYRAESGGYPVPDNRLYDIAQTVKAEHDSMQRSVFGFCGGVFLFLIYFLFFRKQKRLADERIGKMLGSVWAEVKLLLLVMLAVWIYEEVMQEDYLTLSFVNEAQAEEGSAGTGTDSMQGLAAVRAEAEEAASETELLQLQPAGVAQYEEEEAWIQQERMANVRKQAAAAVFDPVMLPVLFWTGYLLVTDFRRNRGRMVEGLFVKISRRARLSGLKQPFAIQQMRRFLLTAAAGAVCAAVSLVLTVFFSKGVTDTAQTVFAQCLNLAVFLCVIYLNLSKTKQQAEDLDLLADYIRSVQAGDYTERENLLNDSSLRELSERVSQIRQGMELAVEEKMKSERMKVELVANVSHDLKTPLTSIISYIAFLKQEEGLPEHVKDYIRILDEKAERLRSIVQDVFFISKAAGGQLPVELKELDFGKLLLQTLADMQEQIQAAAVTIKTEIPKKPVMITADGARMYRVFQNLILNALTYSLEGSRVFVDLKEKGGYATASVKNISKSELSDGTDFTERFVRGDKSRTDGGAGLGLSIAKSFTQACGGELVLETDADLFVVRVEFLCTQSAHADEEAAVTVREA